MRLSGHQSEVDQIAKGVCQGKNFGGHSESGFPDGLI
jgi:hypothetical protein